MVMRAEKVWKFYRYALRYFDRDLIVINYAKEAYKWQRANYNC